jgi:hypothetical protein
MRDAVLIGALALCLVGVIYGVFNHARFVKTGGQSGFRVAPTDTISQAARASYRAMVVGYAVFLGGLAVALFVSAVWGPSGT